MKNLFLLSIISILGVSCAGNPVLVQMKRESADAGEIMYYNDGGAFVSPTPEIQAIARVEKKCPNGYDIVERKEGMETISAGQYSSSEATTTLVFKCKK